MRYNNWSDSLGYQTKLLRNKRCKISINFVGFYELHTSYHSHTPFPTFSNYVSHAGFLCLLFFSNLNQIHKTIEELLLKIE